MHDSTDALGTFSLGPGTFMMLRHIDDGGRPLDAEFSCIEMVGGKLGLNSTLMKSVRMRLPGYGNSFMLGMLESEQDDCGDWAAGSMTQRWRLATMEEYGIPGSAGRAERHRQQRWYSHRDSPCGDARAEAERSAGLAGLLNIYIYI